MLPPHTLQQLSPIAAKIYLLLLSLADHTTPIPVARAPIATLASRGTLSPRSCKRGLAQLRSFSIIQPLPRRYHRPNTYLLPPIPANPPQSAQNAPKISLAPPTSHTNTPASVAKTQMGPPQAPLLNTIAPHKGAPTGPSHPALAAHLGPILSQWLNNLPRPQRDQLLHLARESARTPLAKTKEAQP